jgi:RecA DNA recombination protein
MPLPLKNTAHLGPAKAGHYVEPATTRPGRDFLIAALAARRLDRTLTTSLAPIDPCDETAIGATNIPSLDAQLGGGFPRGQLSELVGARSSGRTSMLLQMMAAATARGELVALVDALDMLDVSSAAAAGVDLDRLLWIRGHVVSNPGLCRDMNQRAMEQAVRALTLVLQAGNLGLVVLDVGEAPAEALRRLPFTTWLRLQKMVEGRQTMCVIVGNEPMARSSAGLTVVVSGFSQKTDVVSGFPPPPKAAARLAEGGSRTVKTAGKFSDRLFEGFDLTARVVRARTRQYEDSVASFSTAVAHHV